MVFVTPSYGTEGPLKDCEQTGNRSASQPQSHRHQQNQPAVQPFLRLLDRHLLLNQRLNPSRHPKIIARQQPKPRRRRRTRLHSLRPQRLRQQLLRVPVLRHLADVTRRRNPVGDGWRLPREFRSVVVELLVVRAEPVGARVVVDADLERELPVLGQVVGAAHVGQLGHARAPRLGVERVPLGEGARRA
jgi:hypothetical protein